MGSEVFGVRVEGYSIFGLEDEALSVGGFGEVRMEHKLGGHFGVSDARKD